MIDHRKEASFYESLKRCGLKILLDVNVPQGSAYSSELLAIKDFPEEACNLSRAHYSDQQQDG